MSTHTSTCARCGQAFGCAMVDGSDAPCWCTQLPPVVPLPAPREGAAAPGCWCRACLEQHIAQHAPAAPDTPAAA